MGAGRGLLSVCQRPSTAQGGDTRAFKPLGRDHGWVVGCIRGPPQGMHPMRDACFAGCGWSGGNEKAPAGQAEALIGASALGRDL